MGSRLAGVRVTFEVIDKLQQHVGLQRRNLDDHPGVEANAEVVLLGLTWVSVTGKKAVGDWAAGGPASLRRQR